MVGSFFVASLVPKGYSAKNGHIDEEKNIYTHFHRSGSAR
jgi:hypothetical protein